MGKKKEVKVIHLPAAPAETMAYYYCYHCSSDKRPLTTLYPFLAFPAPRVYC